MTKQLVLTIVITVALLAGSRYIWIQNIHPAQVKKECMSQVSSASDTELEALYGIKASTTTFVTNPEPNHLSPGLPNITAEKNANPSFRADAYTLCLAAQGI